MTAVEEPKEPYSMRLLERIAVRLRESTVTQAAWRMVIDSELGQGAITFIERSAGDVFRGEGIFLGSAQEELRAIYRRLNKPAEEPAIITPQLG